MRRRIVSGNDAGARVPRGGPGFFGGSRANCMAHTAGSGCSRGLPEGSAAGGELRRHHDVPRGGARVRSARPLRGPGSGVSRRLDGDDGGAGAMSYTSVAYRLPRVLKRYVLHFEAEIEDAVAGFAAALPGGARVLDAGAGEGQYMRYFARQRYY